MTKTPVIGRCRICGLDKTLTEEHIIPRVAGGGAKVKLYSGEELFKTLGNGDEKPYGRIKQNGHAEYTLCRDCNSLSGRLYDEDFADFFNIFTQQIPPSIKIPKGLNPNEYLENKKVEIDVIGTKPLNVAKRLLVSFCSVDHPGLTDRLPEIKKAILDRDYRPNTDNFSLYISLHVGNSLYFGTQAALMNAFTNPVTVSYAGIETEILAFYLAPHNEHLKGGGLINCLDITPWLSRYHYDEVKTVRLEMMFNKSLSIRFPIPSEE
ncbi:MAG: hypothetical protein ABWX94_01745 [Candidatus Saccharimonadales bacterium]